VSVIIKYDHPKELLYKLYREGRRTHVAKTSDELMDSVFNFCVTGHSIRDWLIKHLELNKQDFHDECNEDKYLKYCRDIANSSKHFSLDMPAVINVKEELVEHSSIDASGNLIPNSNTTKLSAKIEITSEEKIDLILFLFGVTEAFKNLFVKYEISIDEQLTNPATLAVEYM
jgi:hypothetical protein